MILNVSVPPNPKIFQGAKCVNTHKLYTAHVKSKYRQFGGKVKSSSDLLENVYTRQIESAKYKSD